MPSRKTHKKITKDWLGKPYTWVHKTMDSTANLPKRKKLSKTMYPLVHPSSHRKDLVHNPSYWVFLYSTGQITKEDLDAAFLHYATDYLDSATGNMVEAVYNPEKYLADRFAKSIGLSRPKKKRPRKRTGRSKRKRR